MTNIVIADGSRWPGAKGYESSPGHSAAVEETLVSARAAAIIAERERIERELSDSASKSLLGISMLAAALATAGWTGDARAIDYRLRELGRLARRAVTEANGVINDLREDATAARLRSTTMAWSLETGISVSVDLPRSTESTELIRAEFGAILMEALANVARHAGATHVRVSLRAAGRQLQLAIEDDGAGFSLPAAEGELGYAAAGGLARMRECAGRLDGVVLVRSAPGRGARIDVRIPGPDIAQVQVPAAPRSPQVRVAIADRNPVMRLGLRVMLERAPDVKVIAEVATASGLAELAVHAPDVLLLDPSMVPGDGPVTISQLGELTSVVLVSIGGGIRPAEAAAAGARLYALHPEFDYGELIRIVRDAGSPATPRLRRISVPACGHDGSADEFAESHWDGLRPREREVMQLIAEGLSNRQIAARLVVSEKTVKNHISSIYNRLGVHDRSQAVHSWTQNYTALRIGAPWGNIS